MNAALIDGAAKCPKSSVEAFKKQCEADELAGGTPVVCLFADGVNPPQEVYAPKDHLISPNKSVRLFVVHPTGAAVEAKASGEPTFSAPALAGKGAESAPLETECHKSELPAIAARPPGGFSIQVSVTKPGATTPQQAKVELIVKQLYFGALRTGIGLVALGAADQSYELRSQGSGMPSQIAATSKPNVDFELTFGFAPFLFDLGRGGRDSLGSLNSASKGFAPYIGVGLLGTSQGSGGVDFFKSLYVGLEWEPMPNFSITVAYVLRRVTRLDPNYSEGSMVELEKVPTVTQAASGLGIVLNLTPEFFRFAKDKK